MLLLLLYNRMIRRAESFVTVTGKAYRQRRLRARRLARARACCSFCSIVAMAAIVPALVLVWTSFFGYALPTRATAADFSTEPYRQLFANPAFWTGLKNTALVAGASAAIVTAIGAVLGWIISRSALPGRRFLDFLSVMSVGIPAVIVGLAVMVLYLSVPIGVYGTVWILILAYSYRFATTTRLARAGFLQIHQELEEASAVSGARFLTTQRRVLLPLILPALTSGFILLFIVGVREFTLPLVLYSQENVVLSVLLWQLFQNGQPAPVGGARHHHHRGGAAGDLPHAPHPRRAFGGGVGDADRHRSRQIIRHARRAGQGGRQGRLRGRRRPNATRCSARAAAARPRRCAASPGWSRSTPASSRSAARWCPTRRAESSCRRTSARSAWCSSPMRSGRISTCS